nr:MAG TPA: hypothetical protein [Caudoviricetes sp.]
MSLFMTLFYPTKVQMSISLSLFFCPDIANVKNCDYYLIG